MQDIGTGRIKIEGDATEFEKAVKVINADLKSVEKQATETTTNITQISTESFSTMANNTLELFSKAKNFLVGIKDHIVNNMKLASEVERGDVAWKMLQRQNEELFQASQNTMEYSLGLLKVRDSVFVINDIMGKGINLNKKLYKELIEQSTLASIRLNKPIETMIDQFVAMGTKMEGNSEEMKMLGIQINNDRVFEEFAKQIGKSVDELTQAEKKTAFLSKLLGEIKKKSTVSFDEAIGLTRITQAYEKYNDTMIDLEERYAKKVAEVGVAINKWFENRDNLRKLDVLAEKEAKTKVAGILDTATEEQRKQAEKEFRIVKESIFQQLKERAIFEEKYKTLHIAIRDLEALEKQTSMSTEQLNKNFQALFNTFGGSGVSLDKIKNLFKAVRQEQDAIRQEKIDAEQKQIDDAKAEVERKAREKRLEAYRKEKEEEVRLALRYFEKLKSQEFETYSDKQKFEQDKLDMTKKFKSMDLKALREYQKKADEVIFNRDKTKKEKEKEDEDTINFINNQIENQKRYKETMESLDNDLLATQKQLWSQRISGGDVVLMKNTQNLKELEDSYKKEMDRFKQYADEKKLAKEDLEAGLLQIEKRYNTKKKKLSKDEFDGAKESKEMLKNALVSTTQEMFSAIFSEEEDAMQRLIANSLMRAGANIYAKGVENVWIGFGELVSTFGLKGGEQMGVGLLQVGAGLGMGYVGDAIMPSGSTGSKEDSAKVENQIKQQEKKQVDESKIFLFPSEQKWLEEVNRANKKIRK